MNCPNCNYEIYEETRFCPKCGADLTQYNMFANIDKGANMATASMICGILALFTGPLLAIPSLIFASKYKKIGNGENAKNAKVGKVCSWISLGTIFAIISLTLIIGGLAILFNDRTTETENININSGYTEEYSDIKEEEKEDLDADSSDLFANIENRYYTESDGYYKNTDELVLYEKEIPEAGVVVAESNGTIIVLDEFYITKTEDKAKFNAEFITTVPHEDFDFFFDYPNLDGKNLNGTISSSFNYHRTCHVINDFKINEMNEVIYTMILVDRSTNETLEEFKITVPIN